MTGEPFTNVIASLFVAVIAYCGNCLPYTVITVIAHKQ